MAKGFEVLDWSETPEGAISLWRRTVAPYGDVFEVKLGDEYLMSSLFTVAEEELSRIGLAAVDGDHLDVIVGGLGLGYTAKAALEDDRVASLSVVEALPQVIDWHERHLVPVAGTVTGDDRTRLIHGDFFALATSDDGFDADQPGRRYDAILVDIDHTPDHHLAGSHADFYTVDGLQRMSVLLRDGGVFALWSDQAPEPAFTAVMEQVFSRVEGHTVTFANPLTGGESANGIYVGVC